MEILKYCIVGYSLTYSISIAKFSVLLTEAEEVTGAGSTCRDRCGDRYNSTLICQCTSNCDRFRNCCPDYLPMCVGNLTGLLLFYFTFQIFHHRMSHNIDACLMKLAILKYESDIFFYEWLFVHKRPNF